MALTATMYRFEIELSDVDRGVYQQLELRVAQHPSEAMRYMLARVLAYCLSWEEGIAFTRGLAAADEPAIWVKDLQGTTTAWIEIGSPAPERLHKASKAVPRVAVFCHGDVEALKRSVRSQRVHRAEAIALFALDPAFLDQLAAQLERSNAWTLTRSEGELYVAAQGETLSTRLVEHGFAD